MKKQFKPNAKTDQANEKNSASGIKCFFKSAPKDFVVAENTSSPKSNEGAKTFYVDILKKLRNVQDEEFVPQVENDNNEVCYEADGANAVVLVKDLNHVRSTKTQVEGHGCNGCVEKAAERDEWEEKYKKEVEKSKALKKVYLNLTVGYTELDLKYKNLLETATRNYHQSSSDDAMVSSDVFTLNEVKFLQCMPLEQKSDCSFILHCLKYAYKLDPSVLVSKTLKGTPEWTEFTKKGEQIQHGAKAPVTPKKAERIKGLFIERISKCLIDSADYRERIKDSYVNKLIAAGIRNISKKYK